MEGKRLILADFIEWATNCGEDVFYIFDCPEDAVEAYLNQREDL